MDSTMMYLHVKKNWEQICRPREKFIYNACVLTIMHILFFVLTFFNDYLIIEIEVCIAILVS